jgi:hypothetical protein
VQISLRVSMSAYSFCHVLKKNTGMAGSVIKGNALCFMLMYRNNTALPERRQGAARSSPGPPLCLFRESDKLSS